MSKEQKLDRGEFWDGKGFVMYLDLDGAAFADYPEEEVSRILGNVREQVLARKATGMYQTLFDFNGNDVGRFRLKVGAKPAQS